MKRLFLSLLVLCSPLARAANWPERPTLQAVCAAAPIVIDGDLSDAAWHASRRPLFRRRSPTELRRFIGAFFPWNTRSET